MGELPQNFGAKYHGRVEAIPLAQTKLTVCPVRKKKYQSLPKILLLCSGVLRAGKIVQSIPVLADTGLAYNLGIFLFLLPFHPSTFSLGGFCVPVKGRGREEKGASSKSSSCGGGGAGERLTDYRRNGMRRRRGEEKRGERRHPKRRGRALMKENTYCMQLCVDTVTRYSPGGIVDGFVIISFCVRRHLCVTFRTSPSPSPWSLGRATFFFFLFVYTRG